MSESENTPEKSPDTARAGKKNGNKKAAPQARHDFLIAGIGASAGGVAALQQLFEHIPDQTQTPGIAYVVVTHLSPDHPSSLVPIIQNYTTMPVVQVNESVTVNPGHVYVIPPGKQLSMNDGQIQLSEFEHSRGQRAPIDLFFRTLAESHKERAVAIMLSGSGSDGSIGLPAVKEHGGLTIVQDPNEAEYDQMPKTAIATGFVDQVLPVAKMGEWLSTYNKNRREIILPLPKAELSESKEATPPAKGDALMQILTILRVRTGHDFSLYKRATLKRRIERRMQINDLADLNAYIVYLGKYPVEIQALLQDLLISVTSFFRDREVWEYVETNVIPALLSNKSQPGSDVRVWIAGCASGEEAYSMAILLHEQASKLAVPPRLQIFATDLDERAISIAREGSYPETIALDVSEERLREYFSYNGHGYRVKKEIRDSILFATHNLLKDPPFSRLDLVSCRNLMIYLNKDAQEQLLALFHFALKPEGFLVLGTSESAESATQLFASFDKKHHIYTRRTVPRYSQPVPILPGKERAREIERLPNLPAPQRQEITVLPNNLHQDLLEMYAPPSVIVDENFEIVHLSNRSGRYLQFSGGEPSINLVRLVHPDLRLELRSALYKAVQQGKSTESARTRVHLDGAERLVRLSVHPVQEPLSLRGYILVIFDEIEEIPDSEKVPPPENAEGSEAATSQSKREAFTRQLEEEIEVLKGQLRLTIEQYETSLEELKASNEELQAINEELRSASEELETSKEEMQAVNEELMTVNQELKVKIEEVSHSNSDLQNLMLSTDIATLFLNRQLRVKRYTPQVERIFNIIPSDVDRPVNHLTHRLKYNQLVEDAETILHHLTPIVREVQAREGEWYMIRLLPYRTMEDRIDGVVLTFTDISERKQAEETLRQSEARQAFLVRLNDTIRPLSDPVQVQAEACRLLGEYLEVDRANYAEILENGQMSVTESYSRPDIAKLTGLFPIESFGRTVISQVEDGNAFVVNNVAEDTVLTEQERAAYASINVAAFAVVMLKKGGRNAVLFGVYHTIPSQWEQAEISLIAETAERTWEAVERARAQEALALELQDTRRLHELNIRLVSDDNVRVLYDEVMATAIAITRADAGMVQLLDETTQELVLLSSRGFDKAMIEYFYRVDAGSNTSCGIALATRERSIVDFDVPESADPDGSLRMHLAAGYLSAQSTPLVARSGRLTGMLTTYWREHHRPGERELRFLDLMERQIADLFEQSQTQAALRQSEERFRQVAQVSNDVIWEWDLQTNHLWWSEGITSLFGYGAERLEPDIKWWQNHIHPKDRERVLNGLDAVIKRGEQVWSDEYRFQQANGSYLDISDRGSIIYSADSNDGERRALRMISAMLNVTRQKREEAQAHFLVEFGEQLRPLSEEKVVFERSAKLLGEYFQVSRCFFAEFDTASGQLTHHPEYRKGNKMSSLTGTYSLDTPEWVEELAQVEPIVINDTATEAIPSRFYSQLYQGSNLRSLLVVSLLKNKEKRGKANKAAVLLVVLEHNQPHQWQPDELTLAQVVLERVWLAVQNARLLRRSQLAAIMEERNRIARYLHDSLQQDFFGIELQANTLLGLLENKPGQEITAQLDEALHEILMLAEGGLSGLRTVIFDLRAEAVASEGLVAGLNNYLKSLQSRYRLKISSSLGAEPPLPLQVKETLYWIGREALFNIIKHAQASEVEVALSQHDGANPSVELMVKDNGRGFDQTKLRPDHAGLRLMQERASQYGGKLTITSATGQGTTLTVNFRLETPKAKRADKN